MKTQLTILTLFCLFQFASSAQTFLNGSFETTTASVACNYNMSNAGFNAVMSNTNGYGVGQELDILINGCYVTGIPDGIRAVGLAANYDEMALQLSTPLVAGTSYTISFWTYGETSFRVLGNLEIGVSMNNSTFGNSVAVVSPASLAWTNHVITFTPTINATHVTVRNVLDGVIHWNHVDNFVIVNPLAVELLSFEAKAIGERLVELSWVTNTEQSNDYFTIEKSVDGIHWEQLGEFDASGESHVQKEYIEYDMNPFSGISYYRLSQTDFDGSIEYFDIRKVEFMIEGTNDLKVYPNPTDNYLSVEIQGTETVKFYDIRGNDVTEKIDFIPNNNRIDCELHKLSAGVYIVQIGEKRATITKL